MLKNSAILQQLYGTWNCNGFCKIVELTGLTLLKYFDCEKNSYVISANRSSSGTGRNLEKLLFWFRKRAYLSYLVVAFPALFP